MIVQPIDAASVLSLFHLPTQHARLLRLTTPLGADLLLAECVRGEEALDAGFTFQVSALSTDAAIPLRALIGQPVLLELLTAASRDQLRPFHGHITAAAMAGANGGLARYELTIAPWTSFLALGRDSRVFQDMTVLDILDSVFGHWGGKGKLAPQWRFDLADRAVYPRRSLTTQYQESDWAFAQRLMHEEGLFHYFEHVGERDSPSLGSHLLVIADHNGSFTINSQADIGFTQPGAVMKADSLDRWRIASTRQADALEIASWDYRTLNQRPAASHSGDAQQGPAVTALPPVREPLAAYAYQSRAQGQRYAENRMQAVAARRTMHVGAGTVRSMAPGTTFSVHGHALLDGAGDDGRSFTAVRVLHLMHNNLSAEIRADIGRRLAPSVLETALASELSDSLHAVGTGEGERPLYRMRVDAIARRLPFRSYPFGASGELQFPKPTVRGQQSAIVVGPAGSVVHTDRDHRIKVQFHWQRGSASHSRLDHPASGHAGAPADDTAGTWVRVAVPMGPIAGANWGSNALPRVGQEVLIDFLEGDIDRPVVIGALYNGAGTPDGQGNTRSSGAGAATGNAPAWFPGEQGGHAHPAVLSGYKSQAMASSQSGSGAYSQLLFDDSPGQARTVLQRHAKAHEGTDELNLGQLRHQSDNQRLDPAGFGAELKTVHAAALRAGQGLLISSHRRADARGTQLDVAEAKVQLGSSVELQTQLADMAQKHNAKLKDAQDKAEPAPAQLPAIEQLSNAAEVISGQGHGAGGEHGGDGQADVFTEPALQLAAPRGIVALTPASAVVAAGNTSSVSAGHDINFVAQANSMHAVRAGISLFTYGKENTGPKPNAEQGIRLHAATGKASVQSQDGSTALTASKSITIASVQTRIGISAKTHVQLSAQGAMLKLEGGNIMLHCPGTAAFKAGNKKMPGPMSSSAELSLPKGDLKGCAQATRDASARQAGAQSL